MKNSKLYTLFGASLLAGSLLAGGAMAQADNDSRDCADRGWFKKGGYGKGHRGGPMGELRRLTRGLDLTDEQRAEVRDIVKASSDQFREYKQTIRTQRKSLKQLVAAESYDAVAVQQAADEQGQTLAQMIVFGSQVKADIINLLTPEQRAELQERMAKRHGDS